MDADSVIEQIEKLPPEERAKVAEFLAGASNGQATGKLDEKRNMEWRAFVQNHFGVARGAPLTIDDDLPHLDEPDEPK